MNKLKQYDFLATTYHFTGGRPDPRGDNFNAYLIEYPAVVKFNLSAEYNISKQLLLILQVRNINGTYRFETNNTQPLQGRSWLFGGRFTF